MRPSERSFERIGDGYGWDQVPTLHKNRGSQRLIRKKSSKRRREDHDREAEIRAMASSMSLRRLREGGTLTPPPRLSSKRAKTTPLGLGRYWEDPSTEDSLPIVPSIRSGMSTDSERGGFQLRALEALAPRPILRYAANPRWQPSTSYGPSRTTSQRRKLSERPAIPEEMLRARKRVDDLADGLDASDIRELMERDKRRRERRKVKEQAGAEKRLARAAAKQKAAQLSAAKDGSPPPQNLERGVLGRELAGLGVDPASAVVTSSKRRITNASPEHAEGHEVDAATPKSSARSPVDDFHRMNSIPLDAMTPQKKKKKRPGVETHLPPSPASRTSPTVGRLSKNKKSTSKPSFDLAQSRSTISPPPATIDEANPSRHSGGLQQKVRLSFTSLFKWASKTSRRSSGPSSFSNASREEMQAAIQSQAPSSVTPSAAPAATGITTAPSTTTAPGTNTPPYPPPPPIPMMKPNSGAPKRTRSRFREDLPELPQSPPPPPQLASPKAATHQEHAKEEAKTAHEPSRPTPIDIPTPTRYSHSWRQERYNASPEPHAISLASVDSEASWLSGRLGGARSGSRQMARRERADSQATTTNNSVEEEHGIAEDEYFSRLTPSRLMRTTSSPVHRNSTGEALPSSDEDEPAVSMEGDMKWGSVQARQQPTVVHASEYVMEEDLKSFDGVLNSADSENDSEMDDVVNTENISGLQRATSINLGKDNAQRISAGSAKILEISPRESADSRRRSSGPVFL